MPIFKISFVLLESFFLLALLQYHFLRIYLYQVDLGLLMNMAVMKGFLR